MLVFTFLTDQYIESNISYDDYIDNNDGYLYRLSNLLCNIFNPELYTDAENNYELSGCERCDFFCDII